jgi:hypothetical protein
MLKVDFTAKIGWTSPSRDFGKFGEKAPFRWKSWLRGHHFGVTTVFKAFFVRFD